MNRLLLAIAVIFALATAGSAAAHSVLPGAYAPVIAAGADVSAEFCVDVDSVASAAVFKSCSKKSKHGIAASCDTQKCIVSGRVEHLSPPVLLVTVGGSVASVMWPPGERQFRPPRTAVERT